MVVKCERKKNCNITTIFTMFGVNNSSQDEAKTYKITHKQVKLFTIHSLTPETDS